MELHEPPEKNIHTFVTWVISGDYTVDGSSEIRHPPVDVGSWNPMIY